MTLNIEEGGAYFEEYKGYREYSQVTIFNKNKYKRIRQKEMDLVLKKGFRSNSFISNPFKTKDIVHYRISTKEYSILIRNTT